VGLISSCGEPLEILESASILGIVDRPCLCVVVHIMWRSTIQHVCWYRQQAVFLESSPFLNAIPSFSFFRLAALSLLDHKQAALASILANGMVVDGGKVLSLLVKNTTSANAVVGDG
jgi:hypothetical protein